jgi:coproporphyrinogen III oxidase-like Fe-S oxidoreductase
VYGVYIHIPFCSKRCDYCAFATWTDRHHLHAEYVDACRAELARAEIPEATSVFVGGGTPSLIDAHLLASLLGDVARAPGAEVTVECNPGLERNLARRGRVDAPAAARERLRVDGGGGNAVGRPTRQASR